MSCACVYPATYFGSEYVFLPFVCFKDRYLITFSSKDYLCGIDCPPSDNFRYVHQATCFSSENVCPISVRFKYFSRAAYSGKDYVCPPSVDPVPRFPLIGGAGLTLPAVCPCAASHRASCLHHWQEGGAGSGIPPSTPPLSNEDQDDRVKMMLEIRMTMRIRMTEEKG